MNPIELTTILLLSTVFKSSWGDTASLMNPDVNEHPEAKDIINFLDNAKTEAINLIKNYKEKIKNLTKPTNSNDFQELLITCSNPKHPRDCSEVLSLYGQRSGIYSIQPPGADIPILVYCEQEVFGGGWTVFQNRYDGSTDFYRSWNEYKTGFGMLNKEFWLGLQYVHLLTSFKVNELYIGLEDFNQTKMYAQYDGFYVDSEDKKFALNYLGDYQGTVNDSLKSHAGYKFSTHDNDNDINPGSCAEYGQGGWWFNTCYTSHLNGKYLKWPITEKEKHKGLYWLAYKGETYTFKATKMMIRPIERERASTFHKISSPKDE